MEESKNIKYEPLQRKDDVSYGSGANEGAETVPSGWYSWTGVVGFILTLGVIAFNIWLNIVLKNDEEKSHYVQPGLVIFLNHAFMFWNLFIAMYLFAKREKKSFFSVLCSFEVFQVSLLEASGWTKKEAFRKVAFLAFLYFVPNLFWASSLNYISVPVSIAIQQSNCAFVYALAWKLGMVVATRRKTAACALCVLGVLLIALGTAKDDHGKANDGDGGNVLLGLLFAIVFPVTISFFSIYFKIYSEHCDTMEKTCMLTASIGIANTVLLFPFIWLQPLLGLGAVEMPDTPGRFGMLMYFAVLALGYNFCYMGGIAVLGPLLTSLAVALSLPASIIFDYIFLGSSGMAFVGLLGALMVFGSFVVLIYADKTKSTKGSAEIEEGQL